jgi:hypothetical protein
VSPRFVLEMDTKTLLNNVGILRENVMRAMDTNAKLELKGFGSTKSDFGSEQK